jgi:hypothetical protein
LIDFSTEHCNHIGLPRLRKNDTIDSGIEHHLDLGKREARSADRRKDVFQIN